MKKIIFYTILLILIIAIIFIIKYIFTKKIQIVVSRYNEDIKWTNKFPNVIIYNKGKKINGNYNEILTPNVGREGHTYYKYIYDNYDNLKDYTIFLQGYPFDHSPNIIHNLSKYLNNINLNIDFEYLSERILNCNLSGCKYHKNLPLIEVYEHLFNKKKNNVSFKFGAGAQFIVSKRRILKKPKEFYLKIVNMLNYDKNPIEGYVIERFHEIIFD